MESQALHGPVHPIHAQPVNEDVRGAVVAHDHGEKQQIPIGQPCAGRQVAKDGTAIHQIISLKHIGIVESHRTGRVLCAFGLAVQLEQNREFDGAGRGEDLLPAQREGLAGRQAADENANPPIHFSGDLRDVLGHPGP